MNAMNTRLGRPPQFSLGQLLIAITALGVVFGLPHQFPNFSVMITGICLSALNVVQLPRTTPERSCVPGVFGWIAGWLMGGLALGILDPTGIRYFMADPAIIAAMCGVLGVCTCPLGAAIGFGTGAVLEELDSRARVGQWVKAHRCPARLLLRRVRR
jgi:hypothetical protein